MQLCNRVCDFDPDRFRIVGFCPACGYRAPVPRVDENLEIPTLIARLSCSQCGSRGCSIRIIYTGAGGFDYR